MTLAGAYAVLPFVIFSFLKLEANPTKMWMLTNGLALALCAAYEPRAGYITLALQLGLWVLLLVSGRPALRAWSFWREQSFILCAPLTIFLLLNFYWVFGLASVGAGVGDGVLSRGLFGSQYFNLSQALVLFHPYWSGAKPTPFIVQPIPLYFWLIPVAAFFGALLARKNRYVTVFTIIGLVGLFLTKQEGEPLPGAYFWLFTHLPGFSAFREASKFYALIALSYTVLIPALFMYAKEKLLPRVYRVYMQAAFGLALALLFLPNVWPVLSGSIATTFTPRHPPSGYAALNQLLDTANFSRIFWMPRESRWGIDTARHPRVSVIDVAQTSWAGFLQNELDDRNVTSERLLGDIFSKNYAQLLFDAGSIGHVVVPPRDAANDDDFYANYGDDRNRFTNLLDHVPFLVKSPSAPAGFDIYTNPTARPYVSAFTSLINVPTIDQLEHAVSFARQQLGQGEVNFVVHDRHVQGATAVSDVFANLEDRSFSHGAISASPAAGAATNLTTYFDTGYTTTAYQTTAEALVLTSTGQAGSLGPDTSGRKTSLGFSGPEPKYLLNNDTLTPVQTDGQSHSLGAIEGSVVLYSASQSDVLENGDMQQGLWRQQVEDCNNYDNRPAIAMQQAFPAAQGGPGTAVKLSSRRHLACTGPAPAGVVPGRPYVLSFQYQVAAGTEAGYRLEYNDPGKTSIVKDVPVTNDSWHTANVLVTPPAGASQVRVRFYARPSSRPGVVPYVSYGAAALRPLTLEARATLPAQHTYVARPATGGITYTNPGYDFTNLVNNPSFEQGLWHQKVGDCDAYDDQPAISMRLSGQASDGQQALELAAQRHIACTNTQFTGLAGDNLLYLSFDYQSANASNAGYSVEFNDADATVVSKQIPINGGGWHNYKTDIKVPAGATSAYLTLYAFAENGGKTQVNHYDNVRVSQLPDLLGHFYSVAPPDVALAAPAKVSWSQDSATRKKIHISGATKPFFLALAEAYHPKWELRLAHKYAVKVPESNHLNLNNFENGWYIDPAQICKQQGNCHKNPDGSYDIELIATFGPQKWLVLGLTISAITLVACLLTLGLAVDDFRRHRRQKLLQLAARLQLQRHNRLIR
ncbi:MAG TPA: hypothetical protein VI322_03025 [Candidatus Saccharimonadia bacterium]